MSWNNYGYGRSETVAQKKAKAARKIAALRKKGKNISPVVIEGRTIAKSWWGKAWNRNLESYADFSNRLSRGRSYVTHGCVVDLQILPGKIEAQVLGSGSSVYKCEIIMDVLSEENRKDVAGHVEGKIASLPYLLEGQFPRDLEAVLTDRKGGLFPSPTQFHPYCSCPDSAGICKHLAAVIYGIGNRLDSRPELLFVLRGMTPAELVFQAVSREKENLINRAKKVKSSRLLTLGDDELSDLFHIDFAEPGSRAGIYR